MPDNKHESETLRQRRLANKEFLELKKMQSGEIIPENTHKPNPADETISKKAENFWFYYGKFLIVGIISFIALFFAVRQCITKPKYDLKVIYFTYEPVIDSVTETLSAEFQKITDDTNGDGEVLVSVINCSYNPNTYSNVMLTKLQAIISSDDEAMMFITDENSIKYFDNIRSDTVTFFEKDTKTLPEKYFNDLSFKPGSKLTVSVRNIKGTTLDKNSSAEKYHKTAKKLLERIE